MTSSKTIDRKAFRRSTNTSDETRLSDSLVFATPHGIAGFSPVKGETLGELPSTATLAADGPGARRFAVGTVTEVEPELVLDNPRNARQVYSQMALDALAKQLETEGQLVAAVVFEKDGKLVLIDGKRRKEAAKLAKLKLRVEVRPQPDNERLLYKQSRAANAEREAQTPLDDAIAWTQLLKEGVYKAQQELAVDLGMSEAHVSKILSLADLPRALVAMLAEQPELLGVRMLYAIKQYCAAVGELETERLIVEIKEHGLSARDVEERRKAKERGPISRARSDQHEVKYSRGKVKVRRFAGQGRLALEVTNVEDEAVVERLTAEFNRIAEAILGAQ
ncbi:ParB/RepB/Spo0J family partition protein [Oxalobacteraceae bacterium OM1]|nr:ParB/RepB/Spo0J family partition protein [Oxalobacteraceae bacterium OM1]